MDHFSQRIRTLREQRGLSQYALAKAAGVPQVTIWRIETGKQKGIDARLVRRLAIALNVSMDDISGRFEDNIEDTDPATLALVDA
jgi:transcriptional regulator with XRE-family HTH domain